MPKMASSVTLEPIGQSETFIAFQECLSRAAAVDRPVLVVGERGSGKEWAAMRLHYLSGRWQGPLVTLNCAALAPSLMESELFGHERGAFTGAVQRRRGRFESADRGTLFLDEIGNIPLEVQEKILRVVEYGTFERVGGTDPVEVDVRIVGATHADLPALARAGKFKQDLLDRLAFEVLFLPPLRARGDDIVLLAEHFARRMASELGRDPVPRFSAQALEALVSHPWPGNVRELKNVVERAVHRCTSDRITDIELDPFRSPFAPAAQPGPQTGEPRLPEGLADAPLKEALHLLEAYRVESALRNSRHNQRKAAQILGLTYDQFRGLMRRHAGRPGQS